jgi:hypothetical protein
MSIWSRKPYPRDLVAVITEGSVSVNDKDFLNCASESGVGKEKTTIFSCHHLSAVSCSAQQG